MLNRMLRTVSAWPRETRDTLFLLAVIAWVVLPHVQHLPLWCSLFTAAVLLWRGRLALQGRPLPRTWWLLGLVAAALAATWFTHRTLLGRDAGVTLIVVLLALKTLELRARRDAFVVFFLGFFAMLTNFFFSQSLLTAAAMLLALLGLLTALVNAHMPAGRPPLSESALVAGRMALLGAPIMAVLFVLFPRLAPLWGIPSDGMAGRTGLSQTMQVGTIASLALDESIALRVRFEGRPPQQSELYFRGPVLSSFDGREWAPYLSRPGRSFAVPPPSSPRMEAEGPVVRYQLTLEPSNRPWLLVLDTALQAPQAPGLQPTVNGELVWMNQTPVTDLLRYRAESRTTFRYGPVTPGGVAAEYRALPPGSNPRTLQLAAELMQANPGADKATLMRAALERLRTGGYRYTLDPGVYGEHTADEFWFDRKAGFCEHIASAFAVLMRAMDIPSRIVTGYQGGELNGVDGYWVVRQSDAHAWTEVWLAGQGWQRVDPTGYVMPGRVGAFERLRAPEGVFAAAMRTVNPTLAVRLRAAWEALNNSWNQWVLNYTQSKQLDLLRNLGFSSPSWEDLSYVLLMILVGVAIAGAAWAYWDKVQHDPWLRLLARVRRRLGRAGVDVPSTAPPRRIAALVTARYGADARPLADWLLQLEAQRYAHRSDTSLAALRRQFKLIPWPA